MESSEKARELFDKYYLLLTDFSENSSIDSRRRYAKDFAIIAVDEIIDSHYKVLSGVNTSVYEYWQEIKQEIKKL
jgi:hypothetical protein